MAVHRRLAGKVAVVSGAGSGIGRATALRFAAEGAAVIAADLDPARGRETIAAMDPVPMDPATGFVALDVTDPASWERLAADARLRGGVDVLVNAAGILKATDPETGSLDAFDDIIRVNVTGTMLGCRALTPLMRRRPGAAIINIGSVSAYAGTWNLVAYDVSKGAVRNMTKELAVHFARKGDDIRCNAVHPGIVATRMVDAFFAENAAEREGWLGTQPAGRLADPDEIAALIAYLASEEARFMTGGDYLIDGGSRA